jgi:aminoglycoside phosphotransferase (APT) family kinase protein
MAAILTLCSLKCESNQYTMETRVETRGALHLWLSERLRQDGCRDVQFGELSQPDAGYSGRTFFVRASWRGVDGAAREHDLVFRIQSPDQQLFVAPDALRQARTMRGLAGCPGVPVPGIWFTEPDDGVLGAPFYVMERVPGRVPGDVPSWHAKGWTVDLRPLDRATLYDNALAALAALHRVDRRPALEFLAEPGSGTALDRYLARLEQWYEWCGPSRRFGAETLDAAMTHVLDHRPADPAEGVVWGDARVGNMCFADDLSVAALFDWETATLGPPGIDLGWWLMFESYLCEAQGLKRLGGVPGREATIARYRQLGGAPVTDIDYYELLAGVVMTLISSRLADVLVENGRVPAEIAARYPLRAVGLARESLERLGGV